jgi:hypothetical protein
VWSALHKRLGANVTVAVVSIYSHRLSETVRGHKGTRCEREEDVPLECWLPGTTSPSFLCDRAAPQVQNPTQLTTVTHRKKKRLSEEEV